MASPLRPLANPPNPWATTDVEYLDGEVPSAHLEVYEDHTRSILSKNDSPDVGFTWSINPYRGCFHGCAYCLDGDTPILMADASWRTLRDVRVGDAIYGTTFDGKYRRYVKTTVTAHWQTVKPAHRVCLADGTRLIASADHRFLTERGWKYVTGDGGRARLTTSNALLGTGQFSTRAVLTTDYKRGYLCGVIRGDALLKVFRYARPGRAHGDLYQFRLALVDLAPLVRVRDYLRELDVPTREFLFAEASVNRKRMLGIRTSARQKVARIQEACAWPEDPSDEWTRGFLAGMFDAEGSYSGGILRFSNTDERILSQIVTGLARLGFDAVLERRAIGASSVRVRGGVREHLRFFHATAPAITRKKSIEGMAVKCAADLRVVSVEPLGFDLLMYDITTGTGDFIANGVISHNCYARPGHEYLSFGAGTDFERKIVVKPRAPELLREAFEKRSWKGELIAFSGVTDCYQPLEASYRLTRGCLEVCAEYKNPVGIITKSPLIERDADVIAEIARVASARVTISIPFFSEENARAMEPWVTPPARRFKTIARLVEKGVDAGVNVAPVIPGLNDGEIANVLKAARDAGARRAGITILRLPGPVKAVFEERVRAALPLRAERIMRRIRETRGGALYDPRWTIRQTGEGNYAEAILALFESTAKKLGFDAGCAQALDESPPPSTFERPPRRGQMRLF